MLCSTYIKENFDDFLHELKGRAYEQNNNGEKDEREIEITCHKFMDTKLIKPGVWGGAETFKAISKMHNVNIIVLNNDGSCNMPCRLNQKCARSLLIYFSSGRDDVENNNRVHYDSVISVSDTKLRDIANELTEVEIKREMFTKDANCSHISID